MGFVSSRSLILLLECSLGSTSPNVNASNKNLRKGMEVMVRMGDETERMKVLVVLEEKWRKDGL